MLFQVRPRDNPQQWPLSPASPPAADSDASTSILRPSAEVTSAAPVAAQTSLSEMPQAATADPSTNSPCVLAQAEVQPTLSLKLCRVGEKDGDNGYARKASTVGADGIDVVTQKSDGKASESVKLSIRSGNDGGNTEEEKWALMKEPEVEDWQEVSLLFAFISLVLQLFFVPCVKMLPLLLSGDGQHSLVLSESCFFSRDYF